MHEFITPPGHLNFQAKKLFGEMGKIKDGSIAYMDLNGGGPVRQHTHLYDHLFIVIKGEAQIQLGDHTVILKENEAYLVKGTVPHAVWNNVQEETVMIGISLES